MRSFSHVRSTTARPRTSTPHSVGRPEPSPSLTPTGLPAPVFGSPVQFSPQEPQRSQRIRSRHSPAQSPANPEPPPWPAGRCMLRLPPVCVSPAFPRLRSGPDRLPPSRGFEAQVRAGAVALATPAAEKSPAGVHGRLLPKGSAQTLCPHRVLPRPPWRIRLPLTLFLHDVSHDLKLFSLFVCIFRLLP